MSMSSKDANAASGAQEEWDRKELANLKEEIADKKKLMEVCS